MPNPRPLPPGASLRQLRIQAKELCRACREGDSGAVAHVAQIHPRMSGLNPSEIVAAEVTLADAQLVIAREYGFDSWPKLKKHVESPSPPAIDMHDLVTREDVQALQDAVTEDHDSVNQLNDSGLPPLYTARLYRNKQALQFLLNHGAVVDIFACAYLNRADEADILLKRNPDLARSTTSNGMTALHYAAMAGHADVVDVLLRHGSDVDAIDNRGSSVLMKACHAGPWKSGPAEEIIQMLLDHNADIDLFQSAAMGRTNVIEEILIRDGTLIDSKDSEGCTALYHAAHNNRIAAVKLLVERGADLNQSDPVGTAALHRTSQQCSDELIQYLIDHGADAHLCCYVACGDEAGTLRSVEENPDAAHEIFYEFNAVEYAIHSWQLGTLRILLQHGSTLSEEDQQDIMRISDNDQDLLDELLALQID